MIYNYDNDHTWELDDAIFRRVTNHLQQIKDFPESEANQGAIGLRARLIPIQMALDSIAKGEEVDTNLEQIRHSLTYLVTKNNLEKMKELINRYGYAFKTPSTIKADVEEVETKIRRLANILLTAPKQEIKPEEEFHLLDELRKSLRSSSFNSASTLSTTSSPSSSAPVTPMDGIKPASSDPAASPVEGVKLNGFNKVR